MTAVRPKIIDVHAHIVTEAAETIVGPHFTLDKEPALFFADEVTRAASMRGMGAIRCLLTTPEERLPDMDRMGVDVQVLSPSPHQYYYWTDPEVGLKAARTINDHIAQVVRSNPMRFAGLGTLPLQDTALAVRELQRCTQELGLCGVEIGSHVAGLELDDPGFERFFAAAEAQEAFIFLHPFGFSHGQRMRKFHLNNVIGNPLESTLALSHLIFGGVLERHPKLRLCVAHGGGFIPMYSGRMDHAWAAREDCHSAIPRKPSEYLQQVYYDTVVHSAEQLEFLAARYGRSQLLLGTDYPFDMSDDNPLGLLEAARSLTPTERAAIAGGNAQRLLKLGAR